MVKAYTDIEQSKKLAEILPIDSADMRYAPFGDTHPWVWEDQLLEEGAIPCWSLAALLNILPNGTETHKQVNESISCYFVGVYNNKKYFSTERHDDLLDACVEMIFILKENDLL